MLEEKDYQEIAHLMRVIVESDITPKLQKLAEGHELMLETLAPKSRVEELEEEVSFLKSIIKLHSEEIAKLKKGSVKNKFPGGVRYGHPPFCRVKPCHTDTIPRKR